MAQIQYTPYVNQQELPSFQAPEFEAKFPTVQSRPKQPVVLAPLPTGNSEHDEHEHIAELPQTSSVVRGITDNSRNKNIGNMQHVIDAFEKAGINIRITSGLRPGAMTKSGHHSHHSYGNALDITPNFAQGETWDTMRQKLRNSKELIDYLRAQKIGILDETTPDVMRRTGATGAHWHIGPDKWALESLEKILAKKGTKLQAGKKIEYTPYTQEPLYAWFNDKNKDGVNFYQSSTYNQPGSGVTLIERVPQGYKREYNLSDEPRVENGFDNWYKYVAQVKGLDPNPDAKEHYYDYRGYYDDLVKQGKQYDVITPDTHFPDTYKLPGHPTFSIESKYYKPGMDAGFWVGDQYVKPENKYDRIVNERFRFAKEALLNNDVDEETANRLAGFLVSHSANETGWQDNTDTNNYGGYLVKDDTGKRVRMRFDSAKDFWDYHIKNLLKKWPEVLNAKTVDEYYDAVNHTDLGLTTKEKFEAYNRTHRDNPVYLYMPEWENSNYRWKLNNVYNNFVLKYLK